MLEDQSPESDEDEVDIEDYVAGCPIGPELSDQIVGLIDLPWNEPGVTDRAMRGLGWTGDGVPTDDAHLATPAGHGIYGDYCFYMPFAHFYSVGGEVWPDDYWGSLPGWSSQRGAGREEFDAYLNAAVDRFAERLGPPQCDVTTRGHYLAIGTYSWRYAAWRRGETIFVISPALEGYSYSQAEEAVVYMGPFAEDAPFPDAASFRHLVRPSA